MPRHTLYAYVDGADLEDVAALFEGRFTEFVSNRSWIAGQATVVNQQHGCESVTQPDDLPLRDLGLNLQLPDIGTEEQGWFADVEAIARFLGELHRETDREFVIGVADAVTGITDDLFCVSSDTPDVEKLRAIVGGVR
jgi:hypothetical protein